MWKFILKGIFRDRHRYLFPLIIVSSGIMIMVFTLSFMKGFEGSFVRHNARFETGHLKVVTNAYAEMISQKPFDMALLDVEDDLKQWQAAYPQLDWVQRISFGALLDIPDANGETRAQGEVAGFAVDLFSNDRERKLLNLDKALVTGRIPSSPGEVLISQTAFERLGLKLGDPVTLIGSTVNGSMSMQNFRVSGAVLFGVGALDKGAVVADISDIRIMLDMEGGAGEILAYFRDGKYDAREVKRIKDDFNSRFGGQDEFEPVMLSLADQNNLGYLMKVMNSALGTMSVVFIFILGIVLWNSGLMNGIRRWGEFGVRLAIGERKVQVYRSLVVEAAILGFIGSLIGIALGTGISLYFSKHGIDVAAYSRSSSIVVENMIYTAVEPTTLMISFIPGIMATILGAALAGIPIFKRQTSQLFKELET